MRLVSLSRMTSPDDGFVRNGTILNFLEALTTKNDSLEARILSGYSISTQERLNSHNNITNQHGLLSLIHAADEALSPFRMLNFSAAATSILYIITIPIVMAHTWSVISTALNSSYLFSDRAS